MQERFDTTAPGTGALLAGRLAVLLAGAGEARLAEALALVVQTLGVRSAVLRDTGPAGGELRAVAGEVVHVVPAARSLHSVHPPTLATVELPVRVADQDLATLTVVGARPAQLPALRACAAVFALVLVRTPEQDPRAAALLLLAEAADRDAVADDLHDGPVQALVVARYAADAAVRGSDPTQAREAIQAALVGLRQALWYLRPRGGVDLPAALEQLDERLREGERLPIQLRLDQAAAAQLSGAAASTAYRFVQAAALGERGNPLVISLQLWRGRVVLAVAGAVPSSLGRWELRFRALGATVAATTDGVRIDFPLPPLLDLELPPSDLKATP